MTDLELTEKVIKRLGYSYEVVNWYDSYTVLDVYNNKKKFCGSIWFNLDESFTEGE